MKNIFFLVGLLLFSATGSRAQYTTLVAADPQYDVDAFVINVDIKSVVYKISGDSIEFKILCYDSVTMAQPIGFAFGIDSNLVATDGYPWNGALPVTNPGYKYDNILVVYKASGMSAAWNAKRGVPGSLIDAIAGVMITHPDSRTFIIKTPLSYLDNNGKFNIVVGAGEDALADPATLATIKDAAPNSGSVLVEKAAAAIRPIDAVTGILNVYPNPAGNYAVVELPEEYRGQRLPYAIFAVDGRTVAAGTIGANGQINIEGLSKGIYILSVTAPNSRYSARLCVE